MKKFKHKSLQPLMLEDIMEGNYRYYTTPSGKVYPSISSIIKYQTKDAIARWRKRVGATEANLISNKAKSDGNTLHPLIESYLNNQDVSKYETNNIWNRFESLKPLLDNVDNIHLQEAPLYSDSLKLAGRVDCIAEYKNELAIIDFKTSLKPKKKEWIQNYIVQECAYACMFFERYGIMPSQLVTIISIENSDCQVFVERDIMKYVKILKRYIDEFRESD